MKPPPQEPPLRSQLLFPALIILSAPFPLGCVSRAGGKSLPRLPILTLTQTLLSDPPSCSQGPISEPGLTLGGNQHDEFRPRCRLSIPTQPLARLPPSPEASPRPPPAPPRWALGTAPPSLPPGRAPRCRCGKRLPGELGATSELAPGTLQLPARPARGRRARRGPGRCAPSSRQDRGDAAPDRGFQSRAQPGQTQPDTLMGCRECWRGGWRTRGVAEGGR